MKLLQKTLFLLIILTGILQAAHVISWVPPYNVDVSKANLSKSWGGYGPKDGISHLALQFWVPDGSGGIEYVPRTDYSTAYLNDDSVTAFKAWADQYSIKTMLCLYNGEWGWDWNLAIGAFDTHRDATINALLAKVDNLGLGGVEIDLEGNTDTAAGLAARPAYITFLQMLGDSLEARGKDLTVASFHGIVWNQPNASWWNMIAPHVTAITSMGYEDLGLNAPTSDFKYASQKGFISTPDQLMLGIPDHLSSWAGNTAIQQLTWIKNDGVVGVGLWDMQLRGAPSQTQEYWQLMNEIRGPLVTMYPTTVTTNAGGSVSPSGTVQIPENGSKLFTITPDQWYLIDDVKVDGISVGAVTSHTINTGTSTHTLSATFSADPSAPTLYTLSATATVNGSISPSGISTAAEGTTKDFTVTPNASYQVSTVLIDGVDRGPIVTASFKNLYANHTIAASFSAATGGDLGKYTEWYSAISVSQWDTVYYNDSLWMFQDPGTWGMNMIPSVSLDAEYGGSFATPPWKYVGLYNGQADTLITADLDYRSAANGHDTLIITTDTVVAGNPSGNRIDTVILTVTPVSLPATTVQSNGISVSMQSNQLKFSAPQSGSYQVSLFNVQGRTLFKKEIQASAQELILLNLNKLSLSQGVYLMQVQLPSKRIHTSRIHMR